LNGRISSIRTNVAFVIKLPFVKISLQKAFARFELTVPSAEIVNDCFFNAGVLYFTIIDLAVHHICSDLQMEELVDDL
jgi:hypothetical protein